MKWWDWWQQVNSFKKSVLRNWDDKTECKVLVLHVADTDIGSIPRTASLSTGPYVEIWALSTARCGPNPPPKAKQSDSAD